MHVGKTETFKLYVRTFVTVGKNGVDGVNAQMLRTLADKFKFRFEFNVAAGGFLEAVNMVYPYKCRCILN